MGPEGCQTSAGLWFDGVEGKTQSHMQALQLNFWRSLELLAAALLIGASGFAWGCCFPPTWGPQRAPVPCSQQKEQVGICQKLSKEASSGSLSSSGVGKAVGSLWSCFSPELFPNISRPDPSCSLPISGCQRVWFPCREDSNFGWGCEPLSCPTL